MDFVKKEASFESSDSADTVNFYEYSPGGCAPRGVVLLIHGEEGFTGCCDRTASFLCKAGYDVFAPVMSFGAKAALARTKNGSRRAFGLGYLVEDVFDLLIRIRKKYRNLPLFLCGTGVGALIAQILISYDGVPADGAVFVSAPRRCRAGFFKERALKKSISEAGDGFSEKAERIFYSIVTGEKTLREREAGKNEGEPSNDGIPAALYGYFYKLIIRVSAPEFLLTMPKGKAYLLVADKRDALSGAGEDARRMADELIELDCSDVAFRLYPSEDMHDRAAESLQKDSLLDELKSEILIWINEWSEAVASSRSPF